MTLYLDRDDAVVMSMNMQDLALVIGGELPASAEKTARSGAPGVIQINGKPLPPFGPSSGPLPPDVLKGAVPDRIPVDPGLC